ncbi:MAG: sugar ABC transporter ATP-binding protein [Deltaproteobacteria bacterium]|nr:sugar ABC transporter ATP-binding protein [Deltaproteobacteria bacterium]
MDESIDVGKGRESNLPLLQMAKITKRFPGVMALDRVDFEVHAGEVVGLVGENGAGKTTLLEILNPHPAPTGFFTQDEGEIFLHGKRIRPKRPIDAHRLGIAIIHQTPNLIPSLTVAENIFLGREPRTRTGLIDDRQMKSEAQKLLRSIQSPISPGLRVAELGAAQQQIVELAKALSVNARLIVIDELTSALSEHEVIHIFEVIRDLKTRGLGIVFVSHRLEEIFQIADRIVVLRDGKRVGGGSVSQLTMEQVVQWMVGRQIDWTRSSSQKREHPLLEVQNLSGSGIKEANFTLHQGEILGITGLVGAGRTRLADLLFGAREVIDGKIMIDGLPVKIDNPRDAISAQIGYVPEDRHARGLVLSMTITENIALPQMDRFQRWIGLDEKSEGQLASRFLRQLQIATPGLSQKVIALSGGNQQKVLLARWLALKPKILILDEPTKGVDVGTKSEIHRLMKDLAKEGMGILMISSELPEIFQLSHRILVMAEGRIVADLPVEQANPEKVMLLAATGSAGQGGSHGS